jgi:hypothetical protein
VNQHLGNQQIVREYLHPTSLQAFPDTE